MIVTNSAHKLIKRLSHQSAEVTGSSLFRCIIILVKT